MKALKITLLAVGLIFTAVYAVFLFVLPYAVNLDKYSDDISKLVEQSTGFKLKTSGIKLSTAWNLSAGLKIKKADFYYPNNEKFAQAKDFEVKLSLLPILGKKIELDSISLESVILHLGIKKDGVFVIQDFIQDLVAKQAENKEPQELPMGLKFSDKLPNIYIKDYSISFVDVSRGKKYVLKGNPLKISDFVLNKKYAIKTAGELIFDNRKQVVYNISINSKFFPEIKESTQTNTQSQVNILEIFRNFYKYNVTANVVSNLKLESDGKIYGSFVADNVSLTIKNKRFPASSVKTQFDGKKIKFESDLYSDINEKAVLNGIFDYSKHPSIDLSVKTEKTDLANAFLVFKTMNELLCFGDLEGIKASGNVASDFNIKSDFKKIQSKGFLKISDAQILYSLYNIVLNSINADIDFSNNRVNIKQFGANLNGAPIKIVGNIDGNANADITVSAEKLALKGLLATLGQLQILKENNIYSGLISIKAVLKGKLDKAVPQIDILIDNVSFKNKSSKASVKLSKAKLKVKTNGKKINGDMETSGVKISAQPFFVSLPSGIIIFDEKDLNIKNSAVYLNNSKIDVQGKITDYADKKINIDVVARGLILSNDVRSILSSDIRKTVKASGKLPMIIKITGNSKSQNIDAQILANNTNYVSVIDISSLRGRTSLISVALELVGDNLKIIDASMNALSVNKGLSENFKNNLQNSTKIAQIKGNISQLYSKTPKLNGVDVVIPNQLTISIPGFENSHAQVKGDLNLNGIISNPEIKGSLSLPSVSIPTVAVVLKNLGLHFAKNSISLNCNDLRIANSIMAINAVLSPDFTKGVLIRNLDFTGSYLDLDTLAVAFSKLPQSSHGPGTDLGVVINSGKATLTSFKSGGLTASNLACDLDLKKNVLNLKNLVGNAYGGKIAGSVTYNLLYGNIGLNLQGRELSAEPAIRGLTGLKNMMSGRAGFDANIKMRGATQTDLIRSLSGNATFIVNNGQMGTLGKLEHLLYAQNILANNVLRATLGVIAKAVTIKDTGSFKYIRGKMTFSNGWANISAIQMAGPNMSMYINGKYNILNNSVNLTVLGRLSADVVDVLGPIGDFSMDKLLSSIPKIGAITSSLVNQMTTSPNSENTSMIPALTTTSSATKEFKVVINGGIESQSSIKSFKWLSNPQLEAQTQTQTQVNIPKSVTEAKQQLQNAGKNVIQQVIGQPTTPKTQTNTMPSTKPKSSVADFINNLPDLAR